MPSLEILIQQWRDSMRKQLDADAIDELENHLRESIADQTASGKSLEEAFRHAASQIGSAEVINSEFDKVSATDWWAVKATLLFGLVLSAICCLYFFVLWDRPLGWLLGPHVVLITLGYVATYLCGALGIAFVCQRIFSNINYGQLRSAARAATTYSGFAAPVTALAILLGMLWAKLAWGRLWAWDPKETGAFGVLVWQILFFAFGRSQLLPPRHVMVLAIFGNIVVSFGWFAPNRSYAFLVALLALHAPFLALSFAPNRRLNVGTT